MCGINLSMPNPMKVGILLLALGLATRLGFWFVNRNPVSGGETID
jgi:hypothetical protein